MFDDASTPAIDRLLTSVLDLRSDPPNEVETAALLDALTAEEVALLRREITTARAEGKELFRCPACGSGLVLSTLPLGPGLTGGGRTFFKHAGAAIACPLRGDETRHPDDVDAIRFDDKQEGARHETLKLTLAGLLATDPAFSEVAIETPIVLEGGWRRPDVQAVLDGTRVVFEVQLAPIQLPRIIARERAYAQAGIRLVWVVDADRLTEEVWRQSHQDLLAGQGGRLIAIGDVEVAEMAFAVAGLDAITMPPRDPSAIVRLVTVREREGGFDLDRRSMPLRRAVDLVTPVDPAARSPLARDRLSQALFAALRDGDGARIGAELGALCDLLDLEVGAEAAQADGVPAAVAAVGTSLTGAKCDASNFGEDEATAILNNFLHTERHRPWAPLFAQNGSDLTSAAPLDTPYPSPRETAAVRLPASGQRAGPASRRRHHAHPRPRDQGGRGAPCQRH
ncbi:competence protein CoiA family protein [Pseudoroseicyclus sp. H15]